MSETQRFEVEKIVDARFADGKWEYFIKWAHFPDTSNSWEPEKNIDCSFLIQNFWKTHKKEDHLISSKKYILPKMTLELASNDTKEIFSSLFPMIECDDIESITGYKKGKDGLVYYYAMAKKYPAPVLIPSRWLSENAPNILVNYLESLVKT